MQYIEFYKFMKKAKNSEELKKYLNKVESLFSPREKSCIDLIFALVTNYGTKAKTVVELSLSKFFKKGTV